ncbi:MAG: flagellar hook basal-body protein [Balneolia bacterium]|nr:flagellar hook basal-body protein [Balneolia bacterium]
MIDRFQVQMQALQMFSRAQEVTANNLANINTPGYKGSTLFYKLLDENVNGVQTQRTVPMNQTNFSQGELELTGNMFDIGISGSGFFMVEDDGQQFLSRDGRFRLDTDGYLVDSSGANVMGSAGPVHIPEYFQTSDIYGNNSTFEVSKDGTIRINDQVHDKIRVVNVADPSQLERRGNAYFAVTNTTALQEEESPELMQGYFEKGNVDALHEMVDMMKTMQMFDSQQRALRTTDETLSAAINSLGRF